MNNICLDFLPNDFQSLNFSKINGYALLTKEECMAKSLIDLDLNYVKNSGKYMIPYEYVMDVLIIG